MTKRCYYEVLEVERTVDEVVLKSAFRKKAMARAVPHTASLRCVVKYATSFQYLQQ